ncbi:MAG: hypothetical protein AB8H79_14680 [Myxococcota bacterium]
MDGAVLVTAIDLAGNESDAVRVQGNQVASGCSSLAATAPLGLFGSMALALGLIGLRRRRLG